MTSRFEKSQYKFSWTPEEAVAQREEFGDALRRLGDQATLVAAEFRTLEAQWRREHDE